MTREEFNSHIQFTDSGSKFMCFHIVDAYVDSLEQRITELEASKTCEGCIYFVNNGCEVDEWCRRDDSAVDYYTPKEIQ